VEMEVRCCSFAAAAYKSLNEDVSINADAAVTEMSRRFISDTLPQETD